MMFYLILVIVYIVPRADIYQYCVNKSPIHECSLSWITELTERDRGHLAKIMYHVRNCTKFDKTDVVTKWLSKGKRSMSMFWRVLSCGRIAWNGNRDDVKLAVHLICIDHTADVTVTYVAVSVKVYKTTELRGPQQNQALVCLDGKVSKLL